MAISNLDSAVRRRQAVEELEAADLVDDPAELVSRLHYGLGLVRDLLYERIHHDVETRFGVDSMLMPVSEDLSASRTKGEIDSFQIIEAAEQAAALAGSEMPVEWFTAWLARWRLGNAAVAKSLYRHLDQYAAAEPPDRQHRFSVVLERTLPEATRAPLILYRLLPLASRLTVAKAWDNREGAETIRRRQLNILPAIADCQACRGRVLDCGETCAACGNPIWKFDVLLAD